MLVDANYVSGLVTSLENSTATQAQLSNELSTGLSVTEVSDNPVAAGESSLLGASISQDDTFVQTAATTESRMQVSDSALGGVVTQLTSALSLATQASNGTNDAADMTAIAQQLVGVRDDVISLANTSYQGSYVFAGSQGGTAPFTLDTSTSPATVTYNGDTNVGSVTTPSGQQIQTSLAGSAVFTAPGASVLGSLNTLIADVGSGAPTATLTADTTALTAALDNVTGQRSVLDSSLSRLNGASSYVQTDATEKTATQTALVSANTATVATQLSAVETQTQALDSVITADEKQGLFSYLQG